MNSYKSGLLGIAFLFSISSFAGFHSGEDVLVIKNNDFYRGTVNYVPLLGNIHIRPKLKNGKPFENPVNFSEKRIYKRVKQVTFAGYLMEAGYQVLAYSSNGVSRRGIIQGIFSKENKFFIEVLLRTKSELPVKEEEYEYYPVEDVYLEVDKSATRDNLAKNCTVILDDNDQSAIVGVVKEFYINIKNEEIARIQSGNLTYFRIPTKCYGTTSSYSSEKNTFIPGNRVSGKSETGGFLEGFIYRVFSNGIIEVNWDAKDRCEFEGKGFWKAEYLSVVP